MHVLLLEWHQREQRLHQSANTYSVCEDRVTIALHRSPSPVPPRTHLPLSSQLYGGYAIRNMVREGARSDLKSPWWKSASHGPASTAKAGAII